MESKSPLTPLELKEALTLAALVLEFEAENSQATEWRNECLRAKLSINAAISRPPAGEFFVSADEPRKKLNGKVAKETDMSHQIIRNSKQQNSNQSEIKAIVRAFFSGKPMNPDHWLTKELKAITAEKTKDAPAPHPLFQTGYLGGTPPIAGGSNGSKSKEAQKGIGILDGFYAANQRQNRRR